MKGLGRIWKSVSVWGCYYTVQNTDGWAGVWLQTPALRPPVAHKQHKKGPIPCHTGLLKNNPVATTYIWGMGSPVVSDYGFWEPKEPHSVLMVHAIALVRRMNGRAKSCPQVLIVRLLCSSSPCPVLFVWAPRFPIRKILATLKNLILFRKQNKRNQKMSPITRNNSKSITTAEIKREDGKCELERTSCEAEGWGREGGRERKREGVREGEGMRSSLKQLFNLWMPQFPPL